jgi:predicted O-methyltransferase YrrM
MRVPTILETMCYDTTLNGDSDAHILSLFSIVLGSRAKHILELGVRDGRTTLPLLYGAYVNEGFLISVDINPTTFEPPDPKWKKYWNFIQSDAIEFLESYNYIPDIVYIDDWHSYEHVKKEFELLDKIVSPSTIILVHDLMYGNTCPYYHTDLTLKDGQWANGGPYRAISELNPQFWEFATLPYCNGLTLVRKKYSSKYAN